MPITTINFTVMLNVNKTKARKMKWGVYWTSEYKKQKKRK